jgi:hypothetical protein
METQARSFSNRRFRARNAGSPERLDPIPPLDLTYPWVKAPEFGDSDGLLTYPSHHGVTIALNGFGDRLWQLGGASVCCAALPRPRP